MVESTPQVSAELEWTGDLRFLGRSGNVQMTLDSEGLEGPSPVQALALALAGCMGMDLVHILRKGRHRLDGLRASLSGTRRSEEPRRFTAIALHFAVQGAAPGAQIERAIELSREKYCSVWHSLRQDIDLRVTYEVDD